MLLNTAQLAEKLGLKEHTLEQWRVSGKGPPFRKMGASVRYDQADVTSWLDARRATSTASATPA